MSPTDKIVKANVTFKNTQGTDALKAYATEKLTHSLKKFVHHDTEAHIVLQVEKNRQVARISFFSGGVNFEASEESDDLYKSIDALVDSISIQLRKHKEKVTKHHK